MLFNKEHSLSFDEFVVQVIWEETGLKALPTTLASLPTESQAFILKHNIGPTREPPPNLRFTQAPNAKLSFNHSSYTKKMTPKWKGDSKDSLW